MVDIGPLPRNDTSNPQDPTGTFYCKYGDHLVDEVVWLEQLEMGCKDCMLKLRDTLTKDRDVTMRLWSVTKDGMTRVEERKASPKPIQPEPVKQQWRCTHCAAIYPDTSYGHYNTVTGFVCNNCHPTRKLGGGKPRRDIVESRKKRAAQGGTDPKIVESLTRKLRETVGVAAPVGTAEHRMIMAAAEAIISQEGQAALEKFERRLDTAIARKELAEKYGLPYDDPWLDAKLEMAPAVDPLTEKIRYDEVSGEPFLASVRCVDCGKECVPPQGWDPTANVARCGRCWRNLGAKPLPRPELEGIDNLLIVKTLSQRPAKPAFGTYCYVESTDQLFTKTGHGWVQVALRARMPFVQRQLDGHHHAWMQEWGEPGYFCGCGARVDTL